MNFSIIILILCVLSSLFAFPYGTWEFQSGNKLGGIAIYFFGIANIAVSIIKFFIPA